jgi:type IX secretion system PorP/SprF family membrane protein
MRLTSLAAILLFFLFYPTVYAQQEPQFSQNMFNNMGINPGYAGLRGAICATGLARQQWVGFKDAEENRLNPETYLLNVDAPLPFLKGGLALGFMQDKLGYENSVGVKISYAYHIKMYGGKLGIGAQAGFLDKRIDFSQFSPIIEGDPALTGGAEESYMFADFALGGFFLSDNNSWAGISFSQLRQASGQIGESNHMLKRHAYFTGGYNLTLAGNPAYALTPSLLVKTDLASVQVDINAMITYNNRFWGGVSYRLQDAVVFLFGLNIEQISVGYSYDFTTSPLGRRGRSFGSHEIMLQYCFDLDLDKIREIQRNVRFL